MTDDRRERTARKGTERQQQRLQMVDIARLAGVSTATVSRALNGSPLVNPETRQRVVELARSLNYTINIGAQSLRLGHNRTVGVVIPFERSNRQRVSDPFFLSLLGSLADALTDEGHDMLVSRVDAERLDQVAHFYDSGRAVGIILIGQWHHPEQLDMLAARGIPMVVWGARLARQLYCTVGSDNEHGGFLAARHLLDLGRRRLCFLGDTGLPEVAQRFAGFLRAHAEAGLPHAKELCIPTSFLADSARTAIRQLLGEGLAFDGIFACSDLLAVAATGTLIESGYGVPAQVAVVGYDDVELAAHFHPTITTIRQPIDEGGRALVATLLELLRTGQSSSKILPASLVARGTTRVNGAPA